MFKFEFSSYQTVKRILDIVISMILIILLSPVLIFSAVLINTETKGGVLYLQKRLGRNGKVFPIFKFRSMSLDENRGFDVQTMGHESSITRTGKIMRRTKIDELPQLFNVLKGDMSLVGPRPCLPQLREEFDENGRARLKVRPGITGLAQVNGNIHLDWEERWKLDRAYTEHMTLNLDIEIILRTVAIIIFGDKWGMRK